MIKGQVLAWSSMNRREKTQESQKVGRLMPDSGGAGQILNPSRHDLVPRVVLNPGWGLRIARLSTTRGT